MSKEPPGGKPNYGSAIRMAQITHWLHRHPFGLLLSELRQRLGISDRTLARYVNTLRDTFFDEQGDPAVEVVKSGGQGRLRFTRKRVQMEGTAYELMSLYMALDLMAFLDGTFFHEGAQEVLDRLQKNLLRDHGNEAALILKDFHKKFFHWTEAPKDYSAHNEILTSLVRSLVLQKYLEMEYQSPGKEAKRHVVAPLSLLMYKRALYLVGRKKRDSSSSEPERELTFAVERIRSVQLLTDSFFYPQDYQPEHRFRNSFGLVRETSPEPVRLWFHPRVAQNVSSRRWHPSQETTHLESGGVELAFMLEIGVELLGWIMSYGPFVKVLEPEGLRKQVAERLREALSYYETTEQ